MFRSGQGMQALVNLHVEADLKLCVVAAAMCVYSMLFMRFAWVVKPRNLLLLSCHMCNETVQLYQLSR